MEPWQCAIAYHDRTKHHFHGYARSLGYLDWATQPNPFRRFDGAPCIPLPRTDEDSSPPYSDIYALDRVAPKPVCSETISEFFYLSLAISAWKEFAGSRWALRCNPSSGNLHPTESYLVIGRVEGLSDAPGVLHYAPEQHALEMRTRFGLELWERLLRDFPPRTFFVGLSSIHWREAWKYGERAYRYCQQDMGHALAACSISGATLGWRVHLINQMSDINVAKLLGLHRRDEVHEREREDPEAVLAVIPSPNDVPMDATLSAEVTDQIAAGEWHGRPNRLSSSHVQWERIDAVAHACMKPTTVPNAFGSNPDYRKCRQRCPAPLRPRARSFATVEAPWPWTAGRRSPKINFTLSSAGFYPIAIRRLGTPSAHRSVSTWGSSSIASPVSTLGSIAWSGRPSTKNLCATR